jgi:hypothetical protein
LFYIINELVSCKNDSWLVQIDDSGFARTGLNIWQNKHVLRESRGKRAPQNTATRLFILSSKYYAQKHTKNPQKCRKNEIKH